MVDLRSGADALPQVPRVAMSAQSLATDVSRKGTAIGQTQVAQNKSLPPEDWTGAAADAASSEIQKLGEKTVELSQAFSPVSTALNTWADAVNDAISAVTDLQKEWDEAVSTYNKTVEDAEAEYKANDPGFVSAIWGDRDHYTKPGDWVPHSRSEERQEKINGAETVLTSSQTDIHNRYVTALNKLDDAAQTAANDINNARRNIVSDTAGSGGRTSVGAALFPAQDMPYTSSAATWEDAQEKAPQIAEALKKQPMSIDDLKSFNQEYGALLANPFYAAALSQYASMDDLFNASLAAREAGFINGKFDPAADQFNRNLGSLMVMATGGTNVSTQMWPVQRAFDIVSGGLTGRSGETIPEIVQSNLSALQEVGRKEYLVPAFSSSRVDAKLQGYDFFGQLAGSAGRLNKDLALGPGFYDSPVKGGLSVFADMVAWDHESSGWDHSQQNATSMLVSQDVLGTDSRIAVDPLQGVLELSDTPDRLLNSVEPVLKAQEETRLSAMRTAFDADTTFNVNADSKMNMVRYLTGWRGHGVEGLETFPDQGEALGDILNDVSKPTGDGIVEPNALDYPQGTNDPEYQSAYRAFEEDKKRARIAQNLLLGYQDGLDHFDINKSDGEDDFGAHNAKMRSWIGTIIAPRVDDLASMLDSVQSHAAPAGNVVGLGGHVKMNLDADSIKRMFSTEGLFTDLAFDHPKQIAGWDSGDPRQMLFEGGRPPALQALQTSAWAGYRYRLGTLMDTSSGTPDDFAANVQNNTAGWRTLLDGLDGAPSRAHILYDDQVEERNKLIRGFIDLAFSAIPSSTPGFGMDDALKFGIGQVKDEFLDMALPTDMSSSELTEMIKKRSESSSSFVIAAQGAYLDSDNWVNDSGLTKQELVDQFIGVRGYDNGIAPGTKIEDMNPKQREALIAYLSEEADKGSRTALKNVIDTMDSDQPARASFFAECEAAPRTHELVFPEPRGNTGSI